MFLRLIRLKNSINPHTHTHTFTQLKTTQILIDGFMKRFYAKEAVLLMEVNSITCHIKCHKRLISK